MMARRVRLKVVPRLILLVMSPELTTVPFTETMLKVRLPLVAARTMVLYMAVALGNVALYVK